MTRLDAEANLQFVPIAPDVVTLIASLVAPAPAGARMVDVCAGEGEAAAQLAAAWGIERDGLFLNELADGRKERCRRFTDHVLGADAIRTLQASRALFQVAWTNPPFGVQPRDLGGGRLEPLFFRRIVEEGGWIQPGGVHLMLAPQDVWASSAVLIKHLARCYDRLTIVALPAAHRRYREALIIGVVRAAWRSGGELQSRAQEIAVRLHAPLPELQAQPAPHYTIPAPVRRVRQMVWRDLNAATPAQAQRDVLAVGGAWGSRAYRAHLEAARRDRPRIRPLFPLGKVAAALRIAQGDINNMIVTLGDRQVRIKGGTRTSTRVWSEERTLDSGAVVIETHRTEQREPVVVTVDVESAAVTRYVGDAGIAALMDQPGATQRLLDAVAQSAPPIYNLEMPDAVARIVARIAPVSGRALPGHPPGLIPMQQHLTAALVKAFQHPDPQTGQPLRAIGLSAEMGCGKSAIAAATAEVVRQVLPTNHERAFTVLVVAPNHLIGEAAQVTAHDQARGHDRPPLPQWIAEWRDLLPHWHTAILETPAQVAAFYRGADADPSTPRVGFIAFAKFSLGSGWEVAVNDRPAAPPVRTPSDQDAATRQRMQRRAEWFDRLRAQEQAEWEALQARQKQEAKQAQRDQDAQRRAALPRLSGPGVSERTIRRDLALRCGHAFRATLPNGQYVPVWRYADGVYCPDCGRRVLNKDGTPHTRASLRRMGIIPCPYCGGMLGQANRSQDSVGDRDLPVFRDPAFQQHVMERDPRTGALRRAIPWGERPRSNPRIALGDFIVTRGYANATDLVITDEVHAMKGFASARGRIWGRLITHAIRALGLTGSPYGGKASTAYWLLQRMNNPWVRREFAWNDEQAFVRRLGIIDTITTQVVDGEAQTFSGKKAAPVVRVEERNGVTTELAAIMQSQFIFVLLRQMGFHLPDYHETIELLDMPADLLVDYNQLVTKGKSIIADGGRDALSSYLQATLTYPMAPWMPVPIRSRLTDEAYQAPEHPADLLLPHHRWLARHAVEQARQGRGMLVFVEHTSRLDILHDLQKKMVQLALDEHGMALRVAILRSTTVKPGARGAWFAARERDGTHVVLCHPGLVETGMNLIAWPEIVFAEPTYSLYRAMQARKRAMRPTQTRPCRVTWLGYADTMIAQALDVIGSKAAAATLLNGDDLSSGLLQIDPGMSLLQELARRVLADQPVATDRMTLSSRFAAAGRALVQALHSGARDLVGAAGVILPGPTAPALHPEQPGGSTDGETPPETGGWKRVPAHLVPGFRRGKRPAPPPSDESEDGAIQLSFL